MSKHFLKKMRAMELLKERLETVKPAGRDEAGKPTPAIVAYKDPEHSDQTVANEVDLTVAVVRDLRRDAFGVIVRTATTPEAKIAELERQVADQARTLLSLAERIEGLENQADRMAGGRGDGR